MQSIKQTALLGALFLFLCETLLPVEVKLEHRDPSHQKALETTLVVGKTMNRATALAAASAQTIEAMRTKPTQPSPALARAASLNAAGFAAISPGASDDDKVEFVKKIITMAEKAFGNNNWDTPPFNANPWEKLKAFKEATAGAQKNTTANAVVADTKNLAEVFTKIAEKINSIFAPGVP